MQIDALANRFCERGRLDHAIRALGLTLKLPLAGPVRERAMRRRKSLAARLN